MPEDRFEKAKRKSKSAADKARVEREAIAKAESGEQFICRDCRLWKARIYFEYEYNGETKLATRCDGCRWFRRNKI